MSPKMMPKETRTDEKSCCTDVQRLFASIKSLSLDDSFQKLEAIDQENQELQTENSQLRITNDINIKNFYELQDRLKNSELALQKQLEEEKEQRDRDAQDRLATENTLKSKCAEASRLQKHVEDLDEIASRLTAASKEKDSQLSVLNSKTMKLVGVLEEANTKEAELNQRLATTDRQLQGVSSSLAKAEDALASMNSSLQQLDVSEDQNTKTIQDLDNLFRDAFSLFRSYVGCDIEEAILPDEATHDLRSALGQPALPMPHSNSDAAKFMRVAASIKVCGKLLSAHIFKRTYLQLGSELENILALTAMHNPSQETHLRQVLLKTLPSKQQENRDQLVKTASQEISRVVAHWIRPAQKEAFLKDLAKLCGQAATCWARVQRMENRVRPKFESEFQDDWFTMPDRLPPSGGRQPPRRLGDDEESFSVIWPAFLYSGAQDAEKPVPQDILCPGRVITTAQVKDAADEVSRRTARKLTREASAADKGKKRRDSAVFLTSGESPGAGAK